MSAIHGNSIDFYAFGENKYTVCVIYIYIYVYHFIDSLLFSCDNLNTGILN